MSCTPTAGEPDLLYIDLHLVHEVATPQAFDGLPSRLADRAPTGNHRRYRGPQRPGAGHPSADRRPDLGDPGPHVLRDSTDQFGITEYPMGDPGQGIVHVIGPEQGLTLPGMTIVCSDNTATHGAFGALAFGIGTSEVEHVLATQTLPQARRWMAVNVEEISPEGVTAKDVILAVIGEIGTGGGIGHVIEYRGSTIRALSMEGRMTVCNMSIEAGARAGMVAPDETTFAYLAGRRLALAGSPVGAGARRLRDLHTDAGATATARSPSTPPPCGRTCRGGQARRR